MLRTSPIPREHHFQSLPPTATPAPSFPLAAPSISAGMWPTRHTRQPSVPACPPSVRGGRAKEICSISPEPVDPPHYLGVVFASRVKHLGVLAKAGQRSQLWLLQAPPMRIRIAARDTTAISAGITNSVIRSVIGVLAKPSPPGPRPVSAGISATETVRTSDVGW